jgi:hypothetical protein
VLIPAKNNVFSTLAQAVAIGDSSILLVDASQFPSAGVIVLGGGANQYVNEVVFYAAKSGNALTGCVRGYDGTTAETHASGAMAALTLIAKHITDLQPKHGTTADRLLLGLSLTISDTGRDFYDTDMDVPFSWVKDRWVMATVCIGNIQVRDYVGDAALVLPQNYRKGDRWTDLDSDVATLRVCKATTITHTLADWVVIGRQS